jgi:hypothetical protein
MAPGSSGSPKISDCFIKWKTKFLIYSDFCSHLPLAQEHIEDVSKNDLINQCILVGIPCLSILHLLVDFQLFVFGID